METCPRVVIPRLHPSTPSCSCPAVLSLFEPVLIPNFVPRRRWCEVGVSPNVSDILDLLRWSNVRLFRYPEILVGFAGDLELLVSFDKLASDSSSYFADGFLERFRHDI